MISDASPMHMARDLVARHSDIGFIRGYIVNYFGRAPTREKLEKLREEYLSHEAAKCARRKIEECSSVRRERNRKRYAARCARRRAA